MPLENLFFYFNMGLPPSHLNNVQKSKISKEGHPLPQNSHCQLSIETKSRTFPKKIGRTRLGVEG